MQKPVTDPFQTLGLTSKATPDEVRLAFRRAAMKFHPDRTGQDPVAQEKFKEVRLAYEEACRLQTMAGMRVVFQEFATNQAAPVRPAPPAAPPRAAAAPEASAVPPEQVVPAPQAKSDPADAPRDLSSFSQNAAAARAAAAAYEAVSRLGDRPSSSVLFKA